MSASRYLAATLVVTCVTAWFSYAYFNLDEYFQIIELTRFKLGQVEAWSLPWEHTERIRAWLQPFLYWTVARVLVGVGIDDPFDLAFAFRLVTGLSCVAALAAFVRTTLPWLASDEEKWVHLRVTTLAGFLPYLFVRTSSETLSMALSTAAFAVLLAGARPRNDGRAWEVPALTSMRSLALGGFLLGLAFEARFQTAFLAIGIVAWLRVVGGASPGALARVGVGACAALALGAVIDRWGYGTWTFPAWRYFQANVVEGAAALFGTDPPLAYFWTLPANVFFPVVVVLLALALLAWFRCPRHPVTWATLPFFAIHNLVSHKEERFVFPLAIFATAFVTMALAPSAGRPLGVSSWGWARRRGRMAKALAVASIAAMALLALYPLGWHHHVRFTRYIHEELGGELRAHALTDFELGLPAFHPQVYVVEKSDADTIARRLDDGTAHAWLVTDSPVLADDAPSLVPRASLVWSELPVYRNVELTTGVMRLFSAYNARARAPLKPIRFRSLYRLERRSSAAAVGGG